MNEAHKNKAWRPARRPVSAVQSRGVHTRGQFDGGQCSCLLVTTTQCRPHKHCRKVSHTRTGLTLGIAPHNSTNRALRDAKHVQQYAAIGPYRCHQGALGKAAIHTNVTHTACQHGRCGDAQEASGGRLASGLTSTPNEEVETHSVPMRCKLSSGRITNHATKSSQDKTSHSCKPRTADANAQTNFTPCSINAAPTVTPNCVRAAQQPQNPAGSSML